MPEDAITGHFRLLPAQAKALAKLGIRTLRDLLYHIPARHEDAGKAGTAASAADGERVTIFGRIEKAGTKRSFRAKVPMGEATLRDETGTVKLVWFHQPYIAKMLQPGDIVRASGTLKKRSGTPTLANPEIEKIPAMPEGVGTSLFAGPEGSEDERLIPVYPESRGISSRWIYHAEKRALAAGVHLRTPDPIPKEILVRYALPSLADALVYIHTPRDEKHAAAARKRFAFEEIFLIQIAQEEARRTYEANPAFRIPREKERIDDFVSRFGFPLTGAQGSATNAILSDLSGERPMLRLLEGDVGSGKTAVAATAAYATAMTRPGGRSFGNLQVAYMCPTEILATQHFESFIKFFVGSGVQIGLITGSGCKKFPSKVDPSGWTDISRSQFLKWVAGGEIAVVVGTHALIQKSVKWRHLALAVIDEQHRFGTAQRAKLIQKDGFAPHLLSMTATPIPRTLALTLYGDLDLTLLDEMPLGRKPVLTEIVHPAKRNIVEERLRSEIAGGRQAYVICPRIDEPDPSKEMALEAKSVTEEAVRLRKKVFPEFTIDILHGKMSAKDKDAVMERFAKGETQILVATSVVEVGVNVPNATLIVIEGAERFGLAQLHQLRGRVLRGTHQSYCFLYSGSKGGKTFDRLKALKTAKNGFELSEMDLKLRGAGELGGGKQWGISDIGMEAIRNIKMVEAARTEARAILEKDPELSGHPSLKAASGARAKETHFE